MDIALRDNNYHGELQRIRDRSILRVVSPISYANADDGGEKKKRLQKKSETSQGRRSACNKKDLRTAIALKEGRRVKQSGMRVLLATRGGAFAIKYALRLHCTSR